MRTARTDGTRCVCAFAFAAFPGTVDLTDWEMSQVQFGVSTKKARKPGLSYGSGNPTFIVGRHSVRFGDGLEGTETPAIGGVQIQWPHQHMRELAPDSSTSLNDFPTIEITGEMEFGAEIELGGLLRRPEHALPGFARFIQGPDRSNLTTYRRLPSRSTTVRSATGDPGKRSNQGSGNQCRSFSTAAKWVTTSSKRRGS